ncbi:MAG: Bax inhibitor-1/YccA family protein [Cytophagaceae bacterium]|nr:Bax inhibitor-1/YccA family protein [Cytophagaceae bacterium]
MRTSNPALGDKTFNLRAAAGEESMTIRGTVNKSAILIGIIVFAGALSWTQFMSGNSIAMILLWGGVIGGLILAIITIFKKEWAPVTAPIYAAFEGLALGGISAMAEMMFSGIVMQAILLTVGTFVTLLAAYRSGLIKATENFKLGVVAATGAIGLIYMISFGMRLFGMQMPYLHDNGLIGIGISLVIVVVAALNLVLDFDFIENGAEKKAPKFMEWYAAFGLIVTLVWLYLEILRLLMKLNSRR